MKKFTENQLVIVFDQEGVITEIIDQTRQPHLYEVCFNATQKKYIIEAEHIEAAAEPHITERIKTLQDAIDALGYEDHRVYTLIQYDKGKYENSVHAYLALRVIAAALNEGWEPQYDGTELRYRPTFTLDITQQYNIGFDGVDSYCSHVDTSCARDICFKSEELAAYAAQQFTELYALVIL